MSALEAVVAPGRFAPFHLVALEATGGSAHVIWDGTQLQAADAPGFLSSSSFEPVAVQARRAAAFTTLADTQGGEAFHWSHRSEDGAGSILMKRADAGTRSICGVEVSDRSLCFAYTPVSWSEGGSPLPGNRRNLTLMRA